MILSFEIIYERYILYIAVLFYIVYAYIKMRCTCLFLIDTRAKYRNSRLYGLIAIHFFLCIFLLPGTSTLGNTLHTSNDVHQKCPLQFKMKNSLTAIFG